MPTKFRYDLGETFVITRGMDSCLFVYTKETWNNITNKLSELSFTKKDVRAFQRFFLSAATICEFDKQGRINISSPLAEYASLQKECVIIGVNDRIEIWSKENFDKYLNDSIDNVFMNYKVDLENDRTMKEIEDKEIPIVHNVIKITKEPKMQQKTFISSNVFKIEDQPMIKESTFVSRPNKGEIINKIFEIQQKMKK